MHLGSVEEPLSRVARLIQALLAILTLVTIAAVAVGTYLLARRLIAPLRKVKSGLDELGLGRYDVRIGEKRADELGELFGAFDRAAAALESRYDQPPAAAANDGEGTLIAPAPKTAGTPLAS